METYYEARPKLIKESSIALGFFDGVHPGHKVVVKKAVEDARALGIKAGVVTFKDHPRALIRGRSPLLLTVIDQRLKLFEQLGVDLALVLSFTEELCLLSPREYVENILVGSMGAKSISVGHNHHFGRDREGDAELLKVLGQDLGFTVNTTQMIKINQKEVSSSLIRNYVAEGRMQEAGELLGRPYSILGDVAHGDGRGKTIGFPTANLCLYEFQMIPKLGVYAGRAQTIGNNQIDCVINVGMRPTFTKADQALSATALKPVIEAHLLDFESDLYGKKLELTFLDFLRDEKKFASVEDLIEQIDNDIEKARLTFKKFFDNKSEKLLA
ncbi:MAG: bifunctional riboflavin kinase/FAD synthetase [Candidatus Obscuribacterales bacterium]|nr:bifunctional riboflavin kinase/FAD synthetase [Candidatus Obscuribacterales bacterium]